jgi:hypothetical protein
MAVSASVPTRRMHADENQDGGYAVLHVPAHTGGESPCVEAGGILTATVAVLAGHVGRSRGSFVPILRRTIRGEQEKNA